MPRGVVHAERDAFTVRRELEPCLIGRLADSFEHLPGAADPRQLRRYLGDGPVRQDTLVGRRKTGACGIPGIGDVLRHDGGVAGRLQPVQIEGQGQQRTLAHEQEVALGKDGPGVRLNDRHFHVLIERPDIDHRFGGRCGRGVQEMTAVRQKPRVTMGCLLALRVQCRELRRRPAIRRHAKQRAGACGKHDDAVAVPRPCPKTGGITHGLSRASAHVDPLQLALREKTLRTGCSVPRTGHWHRQFLAAPESSRRRTPTFGRPV